MNTNFTNFFNYAAKEPQNTGGGNSQCALRSEGARQRVSESETRGVNHAIITQLSRNNHPITLRAIHYVAVLLMVFMVGIGQMWGADVEFVAGTSTGQFSQTTTLDSHAVVKLITSGTGGNAQSRQIWKDGSTNKNETAIQFSSSAGNDPSTKYIEISVASGYKITGVTVRGANGGSTSATTYNAYCFAGAYSTETGAVTSLATLAFPGYGGSSDGANVSMTGIANGTRTIRIYKQVKYNSSTKTIGNVTGASNTPSSVANANISKITVTYESTGGGGGGSTPSVSAFSPATGATVKSGTTVTVTGSTGSTVYYMWGSSAPANAAAVVSGGTAGTAGTATVTSSGINSANGTNLYAVAVKDATNSAVATASYTIDDTAPTLSSSTPANSATNVATSGTIVLTFSEAIASVDATKFTLTGATKGDVAIDGTDATKVNIAYSGAEYEATVKLETAAGAVSDASSNASAALSDISFTIESAPVFTASSSVNIEQLILNNLGNKNATGQFNDIKSAFDEAHIDYDLSAGCDRDTLNDAADNKGKYKTNRNYAYLGLKIKSTDKYVQINLPSNKTLKVKFGNIAANVKVTIGDADPVNHSSGNYELAADPSNNRVVKLATSTEGAVVIKQIMIGEELQTVTLPAKITLGSPENGSISVESTKVNVGSSVTVTVTPDDGYSLSSISVTRDTTENPSVEVTSNSFTMPNGNVTINATFAPASACTAYEFHYGTKTQDNWETACFTQVGETNEWRIEGFTVPSTTHYYVGYHGDGEGTSGWNSTWSAEKQWTDTYSDGNGAMVLLPGTSAVGQATNATGTLIIWSNSGDKNKYVGFKPDGYGITCGGNSYAFASTATANVWETGVVTLPDVSTTYTMGLATATEGTYVACAHSAAAEAISNMGVSILDGGKKKIYLVPGSFDQNDAEEKYAVFDVTNDAFDTDFMTDEDGDGVYEGYVGSDCATMILCRMSGEATVSDLASKNWEGARWNQTGDISISGTLAKKYTITSLNGNSCTYSEETVHPTTGQKGKFRIWDNSSAQNWYVNFVPYYTLSYDANGGTGEMATTERCAESATLKVSVAANGFTAPADHEFAGWAISQEHADAGTVDYEAGDDYSLTSDATLYAVWEFDCPTEGTVFSANVAATSEQSIAAGASNLALTAAQATVTGGSISVYNGQDNAKKLIDDASSTYYFVETNGNTFFRVRLNCELEAGDEIKAYVYVGKDESRGLWFAKGTTYPSSAPTAKATRTNDGWITYTVVEGDGIIGEKDFSIFRATSNSTYFGSFSITRPEKFDVTYYKNDGTDASTPAHASVVAANEFTRSGYRFIEWNTQADGKGTTKAVGAAVTADIELYAIWAQEYSVSYANTGAASGDAPTNENKYIAGETFKVAGAGTMVAPTDHIFGGWNDGTSTYQEDDDYTVGSANVSFTPVWTESFNVYYFPHGGSGTAYTAVNVTAVNECFFTPPTGKLFDKWTTQEDGTGTVYAPGAAVTTSINLYAQWKDDECTARQSLIAVTFTGETAATAVVNGYNEKEYASSSLINNLGDNSGPFEGGYKIYSDGGYVFATIAKGNFQEGDKLEMEITKVPGSQKLDVYAYGDDIATAYKVVSIEQVSAAGTYSYALTAANATAINTLGYKSLGLYRASGSNMNAYVKSLSITGCREWVIKHTVTFSLNGQTGTAPTAQSIAEGGLVTKPADPEVAGQFFRGWFTDEECTAGNEWDFANDAVGNTNMTLYAKWEADPCDNRRSIVKAVMASTTTATVTGYNENEYAGGYLISGLGTGSNQNTYDFGEGNVTGYKLAVEGSSIIMASLAKGGFVEGDKVIIAVTKAADGGKLPIYAAKDKNNVVSIANIDVTSPGIYTYTLTAANIATIEAAGEGYMSIGAYRGTYNPFIYSVELTGCRNWSVYHTLTFKDADGSATLASESLAEGAYASTVAPSAPRVKGKRFLGWSESVGGDVVNINEYTITENKILYIVYEDVDCPTSGTIYKFLFKTDLTNGNLDAATNADMTEYVNASGDGYLTYTSTSAGQGKFANDSLIQFTNPAAYLKVDLDCALAAGDRIRVRCYSNPITVQVGTSYDSSKDLTFAKNDFGWQDVTEAMVGKSDLYITRASNGNANLAYFEIYRRPVLTGVTMDDMRLKIGKTGTPVLHLLPADDAIVTSQAWEITASTATGTTINAETGLITAGETAGEMTVQVTLNGDKVASATVAIVQGFEAVVPVTATTTWDWAPVSTATNGPTISAPDTVLANYISGSGWENLSGNNGAYVYRDNSSYKAFQGTKLSFKAAVPGKLKIYAGRTSSDKKVYVNGIEVGTVTSTKAYLNEIVVPAGYVAITSESMRIYNMTFDTNLDPTQAEESFLGGYEREVNPQYYGTVCLPKAGVMVGAMLFQVAYMDYKEDNTTPNKVYYDQVENGIMQAGMPYIFLAEQSTIGVYYTGTTEVTAGNELDYHGLHGTLTDINSGMNATGIYMLYNNQVLHSTNAASTLPANRAYLQISEIPGFNDPDYVAPAPTRRRIATGFNGENVATGLENLNASDKPMKLMINGQIFILRGEKMFDTTGRLVK